jgi:hypothetical protein
MKRSPLERKTPLAVSPEKVREFQQRGRRSSARTMAKPRAISPASKEQRAAIRGRPCIVTGSHEGVTPTHLTDRALGGCDSPFCVVPVRIDKHRDYDEHRLDLLPYLEAHGLRQELAHAVTHLGLIGALQRITNVDWAPVTAAREESST